MERIMSQDSKFQAAALTPALSPAPLSFARWMIPLLTVAAIAVVFSLAGCGPGAGSSASSDAVAAGPSAADAVSATPSAAAAAASTAAQAQAGAPAACPKVAAPRCPGVPAPAARQPAPGAMARSESSPNHLATAASNAQRRLWSRHRHGVRHGDAYALRERRAWDHGRPWPGDRSDRDSVDHDRFAREHDDRGALMGGSSGGQYSGRFAYLGGREREETRETSRSEAWRFGGEHVVVRQEDHRALRPCPDRCRPTGYRTFDYAGIDGRGYLVWPGKVEY
jgi:hypothetical protein